MSFSPKEYTGTSAAPAWIASLTKPRRRFSTSVFAPTRAYSASVAPPGAGTADDARQQAAEDKRWHGHNASTRAREHHADLRSQRYCRRRDDGGQTRCKRHHRGCSIQHERRTGIAAHVTSRIRAHRHHASTRAREHENTRIRARVVLWQIAHTRSAVAPGTRRIDFPLFSNARAEYRAASHTPPARTRSRYCSAASHNTAMTDSVMCVQDHTATQPRRYSPAECRRRSSQRACGTRCPSARRVCC